MRGSVMTVWLVTAHGEEGQSCTVFVSRTEEGAKGMVELLLEKNKLFETYNLEEWVVG